MKTCLWFLLICITLCCSIKAQHIREPYNYKVTIYFNGLPSELNPDFIAAFYSKNFKAFKFKGKTVIDDAHERTDVYFLSKKARDGFLFVNETILEFIEESNYDKEGIKVAYVHNNVPVTTEEDLVQILRLRRRRIKDIDIHLDEPSRIINAYIVTQ